MPAIGMWLASRRAIDRGLVERGPERADGVLEEAAAAKEGTPAIRLMVRWVG
ncbi:hypothetical protein [Diaminobutyricibacter sp. McL0608]|uniref:hypothetical protein n=1 Tax=Leifsonia sp. McL0608 TaxID=3143537 RepID=UPI0031F2DA7E